MGRLDPLANAAGSILIVVACVAGVCMFLSAAVKRGRGEANATGFMIAGAALVAAAAYAWIEIGRQAAHELWITWHAPARPWPRPPLAVAAPEISLGGKAAEVLSFGGNFELQASAVEVQARNEDLIVTASFEALKRFPSANDAIGTRLYAQIYTRSSRQYRGYPGGGTSGSGRGGTAVDLRPSAAGEPQTVHMPLSNTVPYAATGRMHLRVPGGMKHCRPDCGLGFVLGMSNDDQAATAALHLRTVAP